MGFRCFLVGLESLSGERLAAYEKGVTTDVNEDCLRVLRDCGADCVALMMADPAFTREDFRRLYAWARDRGLKYVSVQVYTPIPPTPLYVEKEAELLDRRPEKWDLAHLLLKPAHMTRVGFTLRHRLLMARLYLLGWAARRLPFRHAPVCGRPDRRLVETAANAALRHIMRREKGETGL